MKKLVKSTSLVSVMTLLSRIMGFVRDMVCANLFGAAAGFDAFLVAFKIPNFTRRLFAEGAFSQAFVPVLSEYRQVKSPKDTKQFINRIAGGLASALLLTVIVLELLAPIVILVVAPGFHDDPLRYSLSRSMLYITFPYLLFIALTAFSGAVLNSYGRFGVPAFTPVILNVVLIIAAVKSSQYFAKPIYALAWGVLIAGIVQLLFQLPFLYRQGLLPRPQILWHDPGVKRVLKLMVPALFGVSVAQISILIDTLFASFLPVGSISWLYYSDRLNQFPLGVFGIALATVVLPHLSKQHAAKDKKGFSASMDWALRYVLVVGLPAAVGLIILAGPMLTTLFQYNQFTIQDVMMSRQSLLAYAVGLPAFMLVKVLACAFYSKQDIRTPVRIASVALIVNLFFNLMLVWSLKHMGLALSTSISSIVNATLLFYLLVKRGTYQPGHGWIKFSLRVVAATAIMSAVLIWGQPVLSNWFAMTWANRVNHLVFWILLGMGLYAAILWLCGMRLRHFRYKTKGL